VGVNSEDFLDSKHGTDVLLDVGVHVEIQVVVEGGCHQVVQDNYPFFSGCMNYVVVDYNSICPY
jgi:hypothetical protein